MTVRQVLKEAADALHGVGIADPIVDASLLLSHVTGIAPLMLRADAWREISDDHLAAFRTLLSRRLAHEPLQYIIGEVEFMGVSIKTTPDALIPRYDTEVLCEQALMHISPPCRVLDVCTGTGVIALTLKFHAPQTDVFACDISEKALSLAQENAQRNKLCVTFRQGDLLSPYQGETFDVIVSNPPYISREDMLTLQPEVQKEPELALFGGDDGLDFYRRIIADVPFYLVPGGALLFEIGCSQADAVCRLMKNRFEDLHVYQDLNGLDRVVAGRLKKE